jgi:hypothetical protein
MRKGYCRIEVSKSLNTNRVTAKTEMHDHYLILIKWVTTELGASHLLYEIKATISLLKQ